MLPDFLIAGAPRCGTTTLANTLRRHPEIFIPEIKEVNFFYENWGKGIAWYEKHFDRASNVHSIGEATPSYLASKIACQRIKQTIPTVKLIFLLRNPIARAHSAYWLLKNRGLEEREFLEAIFEGAQAKEWTDEEIISRTYVIYPGYYTRHLKTYFDLFPPEQILILLFDDLVRHPQETLDIIQDFLDVQRMELSIGKDNPSKVPRSILYRNILNRVLRMKELTRMVAPRQSLLKKGVVKLTTREFRTSVIEWLLAINTKEAPSPPLTKEEYELLCQIFGQEIRDLSSFLGRDLHHWLDQQPSAFS